jgi:hypothetical protein
MTLLVPPKDTGAPHGDLGTLASLVRPTSSRKDRLLPVLGPLAGLLPDGGLQRGTVVGIDLGDGPGTRSEGLGAGGATTLGFALLAAATATGFWCAAVGTAHPGVLSIAEMGTDLEHLVLVQLSDSRSATALPEVAAVLLDGMDCVLLRTPWPLRAHLARRLAARARERQAVLVVLGPPAWWPEGPDVRLAVKRGEWEGLGSGHGHIGGRRVNVTASGRRGAARPVSAALWLPAASGQVASFEGSEAWRRRARGKEGKREK